VEAGFGQSQQKEAILEQADTLSGYLATALNVHSPPPPRASPTHHHTYTQQLTETAHLPAISPVAGQSLEWCLGD